LLITLSYIFSLGLMPLQTLALDCSSTNLTPAEAIKCGSCGASGTPCDKDATKSLDATIADIINILSVAVGIVAVIMIIIAGLRYVTSAGNPEAAKGARNTILYAVIGLVVV